MHDPWIILGIDGPTTDLKSIKKAYAARLRAIDPAKDISGFMALRQAYEQAQQLVENSNIEALPWEYDVGTGSGFGSLYEVEDIRQPEDEFESKNEIYRALDARAREILALTNLREDPEAWRAFFEDPAYASIDVQSDLEHVVRNLLLETFGYFQDSSQNNSQDDSKPSRRFKKTARYVFNYFGWDQPQFNQSFTRDQVEFLRQKFKVPIVSAGDDIEFGPAFNFLSAVFVYLILISACFYYASANQKGFWLIIGLILSARALTVYVKAWIVDRDAALSFFGGLLFLGSLGYLITSVMREGSWEGRLDVLYWFGAGAVGAGLIWLVGRVILSLIRRR